MNMNSINFYMRPAGFAGCKGAAGQIYGSFKNQHAADGRDLRNQMIVLDPCLR